MVSNWSILSDIEQKASAISIAFVQVMQPPIPHAPLVLIGSSRCWFSFAILFDILCDSQLMNHHESGLTHKSKKAN